MNLIILGYMIIWYHFNQIVLQRMILEIFNDTLVYFILKIYFIIFGLQLAYKAIICEVLKDLNIKIFLSLNVQ